MKRNNLSKKWIALISTGFLFATISTYVMTQQSTNSLSSLVNDISSIQTRYNEENPLKIQCFLDATNDLGINPSSFYASLDFLSNEITLKNTTYTTIKGEKVLDRFFNLVDNIQSTNDLVEKNQIIDKFFHFQGLQTIFNLSRAEFQERLMDTQSCRRAFNLSLNKEEVGSEQTDVLKNDNITKAHSNLTLYKVKKHSSQEESTTKNHSVYKMKDSVSAKELYLPPMVKEENENMQKPLTKEGTSHSSVLQDSQKVKTDSSESVTTKQENLGRKQLKSYATQDALMSN